MKKIMIIDGGPSKTMNTAQMVKAFIEGVHAASDDIEVKHVSLRFGTISWMHVLSGLQAEGEFFQKQAYKDAHWAQDLQNARDAGKRMVEKITQAGL